VAVALTGSLSCKAQVQANAEANIGGEDTKDFNKPLVDPAQEAPVEGASKEQALLGARPDLSYGGTPTATCKCLAVAVGQPGDTSFHWSGERPHTSPDSQLVIALTSSGVACSETRGTGLGASYWGYEMKNDDVVVVVEPAVAGRPLTSGAIIPRPLGNGRVYVRPSDKTVPYGRPASGSGAMCAIGGASQSAAKPNPLSPPSAASARVRIGGQQPAADTPEVSIP
jgi:hypothetical protein